MSHSNFSNCLDTNSLIDEINESCNLSQSHKESGNDSLDNINIKLLEPVDSIENINIELLEPISTTLTPPAHPMTRLIKVSREGQRKQRSFKSRTATMMNHTVQRQKKTTEQLDYLNSLFKRLGGNWSTKVKREAMKKTGLTRT